MYNLSKLYKNGVGKAAEGGIEANPALAAKWAKAAEIDGKKRYADEYGTAEGNGVFVALRPEPLLLLGTAQRMIQRCFTSATAMKALRDTYIQKKKRLETLQAAADPAPHRDEISKLGEELDALSRENRCSFCMDCLFEKDSLVTPQCQRLREEVSGRVVPLHFFCAPCFTRAMQSGTVKLCPICRKGECDRNLTGVHFDSSPTSTESSH